MAPPSSQGEHEPLEDEPQHPRAARIKLSKVEMIQRHLEQAQSGLSYLGLGDAALHEALSQTQQMRDRLAFIAKERIEPRKRFPKVIRPEGAHIPEYYLCLDECGSHVKESTTSAFPVFCLSGVIIAKAQYETIDGRLKDWKTLHLGSPSVILHEPDIRTCSGPFYRSSNEAKLALWQNLESTLEDLEFTCISAVVDMREFARNHPQGKVDDFLPQSCYLMCIDFIMERFLHFLHHVGNGATGIVIAERRGLVEDAKVHAEFIRLHLEGTQYIAASEFRSMLRPYIEFLPKKRNHSGLQIADLAARTFADIVLGRQTIPARWSTFAKKLYDGKQSRPFSYGLKVFPATETNTAFMKEIS